MYPRLSKVRLTTATAGIVACLCSCAPGRALGQVGDFDLRDPLGFEPLILDSQRGHFFAIGALVVSLLLSDGDDPAGNATERGRTGSWEVFTHGGFVRGYGEHRTGILIGSLGATHFLRDWLSVGIELYGASLRDGRLDDGGTAAVGSLAVARWYPVRRSSWTAFFEWGTGIIVSGQAFPPRGTNANFTPAYGAGVTLRVSANGHILVGVRHLHVSNGGLIAGGERDPFDSNGVYAGHQLQF